MSSTESEVVSANVSLRAAGLPSSGFLAYLQNAGGMRKDSIPGGLPNTDVETSKESNGECCGSLFEVEGYSLEPTPNQ